MRNLIVLHGLIKARQRKTARHRYDGKGFDEAHGENEQAVNGRVRRCNEVTYCARLVFSVIHFVDIRMHAVIEIHFADLDEFRAPRRARRCQKQQRFLRSGCFAHGIERPVPFRLSDLLHEHGGKISELGAVLFIRNHSMHVCLRQKRQNFVRGHARIEGKSNFSRHEYSEHRGNETLSVGQKYRDVLIVFFRQYFRNRKRLPRKIAVGAGCFAQNRGARPVCAVDE